jgi:YHS domain-containing protein
MKTRSIFASALLVAVAGMIAAALLAADAPPSLPKPNLENAKCPVSGKPVKADDWVAFDGGKVYFCCENCPAAFKKDPSKYAAKAHLQEVQTGQLKEVACPLTGKKLNPDTAMDVGGVQVEFCCNTCKGKVQKATGDDQINMVFKDISKGYKPATETK